MMSAQTTKSHFCSLRDTIKLFQNNTRRRTKKPSDEEMALAERFSGKEKKLDLETASIALLPASSSTAQAVSITDKPLNSPPVASTIDIESRPNPSTQQPLPREATHKDSENSLVTIATYGHPTLPQSKGPTSQNTSTEPRIRPSPPRSQPPPQTAQTYSNSNANSTRSWGESQLRLFPPSIVLEDMPKLPFTSQDNSDLLKDRLLAHKQIVKGDVLSHGEVGFYRYPRRGESQSESETPQERLRERKPAVKKTRSAVSGFPGNLAHDRMKRSSDRSLRAVQTPTTDGDIDRGRRRERSRTRQTVEASGSVQTLNSHSFTIPLTPHIRTSTNILIEPSPRPNLPRPPTSQAPANTSDGSNSTHGSMEAHYDVEDETDESFTDEAQKYADVRRQIISTQRRYTYAVETSGSMVDINNNVLALGLGRSIVDIRSKMHMQKTRMSDSDIRRKTDEMFPINREPATVNFSRPISSRGSSWMTGRGLSNSGGRVVSY